MSIEAMKLALEALKADQKLIEAYRPRSHTERLLNAIKALEEALAKQEQSAKHVGEPVAWACWLDSQNPETDKPVVVQYEPLAYSKRRPLIYTTLQHPKQEQEQEPVAWAGYNLDDMCEAFDRVIEEHYGRKTPFHDPVNRDAMLALRILRGFVPYMKRYTTPQQRKPLNDCEVCNHKVSNPDGGHCYMFRKEPEFKCANFDLAMPKCEPQPTLYVKDIDGNFHEYAHEIKG